MPDLSSSAIPPLTLPDTPADLAPPNRHRWSPRAFHDKPVPPDALRTLLEAARWAASCFNEQPWRFILATKDQPQQYAQLLGILAPKNQLWAKAAPVLLLSVAKTTFSHNAKPNRHGIHDTGAAAATLCIQAAALGLQAHSMAGFDAAKARELFQIPADFDPAAAIALGYPAPPDAAPEEFRAAESAPRTRKPLSDLVFTTTWGTPADL